ncbi:MAG: TonB-dependent receptor [Bacteroidetes bacterium]|nr:TonB-dependent receptor [Bacteroidota bacterium]MBU1721022.1 TonB-dependent receptor [Bacteroidota bacterium]
MKRYFLFFVWFLCYSTSLYSQEGRNISGTVIHAVSEEPISNVDIYIPDLNKGTVSDSIGQFIISDVPAGTWKVIANHISYRRYSVKVNVYPHASAELTISLINDTTYSLPPLIVTDTSSGDIITRKAPYVITSIQPAFIHSTSIPDIGQLLRFSANVGGIRKGGSGIDPVVRGFRSGQLNVQLNSGQRIEGGCPNRMDPTAAHIEKEEINSIEVIKGPYALRFGPSIGGIINIKTKMPQPIEIPGIHIAASRSFDANRIGNAENIDVYGGDRKTYFLLTGIHKDYGNYTDGNGNEVKSAYTKYAYKGVVTRKIGENHRLSITYCENKGRNVLYPALPMDERSDNTALFSLDYKAENISDLFTGIEGKIYHSSVDHVMDNKYRSFSDTVAAISSIMAESMGYRFQLSMSLGGGTIIGGTDHERTTKDGARIKNMILQPNLPVKTEQIWNDALITNYGLFLEYFRSEALWDFIFAVRSDVNHAESEAILMKGMNGSPIYEYGKDSIFSDFVPASFSAGYTRKISEAFSVSFSAGRASRCPDMTERFIALLPVGYDNFDYLGNPSLKPETNNQADITLRFKHPSFGKLYLNGFYAYVQNYISAIRLPPSSVMPLTTGVLGVKQFTNIPSAQLSGFEAGYEYSVGKRIVVMTEAGFTYGTQSEAVVYMKNQSNQIISEKTISNDAIPEIPPFEGTFTFKYYFLKKKFVPLISFRYAAAQENISAAYEEKTTPAFWTADFRMFWNYNTHLQFLAGVSNILDKAYYEHLNRRTIGSSAKIFEPGRVVYIKISINI